MHKISVAALSQLLNTEVAGTAITIYLPTHRQSSSATINEDQIRFKNAISRAQQLLEERGVHREYAQDFLEHCEALMNDLSFWQHLSDSLLVCASPHTFQYFHLPADSEEYVNVNDNFHLTPALGLANSMQGFYVLSIAQQHPQLYKGDVYEIVPAELTLPDNLETALNIDELYQKNLQFSSTKAPKGAMYHGHGGGKDSTDDERMRFWRLIDGMVCYDINPKLPLILAGTESEVAEYRSVSKHTYLLEGHIEGSQKTRTSNILHEKALAIIHKEIIDKKETEAVERFNTLRGQSPERIAEFIDDLQEAAENGKVDTLLVGMQDDPANDFTPDQPSVFEKLSFPADSDSDSETIDQLARKVFNQSGSIISISRRKMPGQKLALAINRY